MAFWKIQKKEQIGENSKMPTEEIRQLLDSEDVPVEALELYLKNLHIADVADLIEDLRPSEREKLLLLVNSLIQADVLLNLEENLRKPVIDLLGIQHFKKSFLDLSNEEILDLIKELNEELQESFLDFLPSKRKKVLRLFLNYPEDSIGRYMSIDFVAAQTGSSVAQVLELIQEADRNENIPENFAEIFVLNTENIPIGVVFVKDILEVDKEAFIEEFMQKELFPVSVTSPKEEVALSFSKYGVLRAPVVAANGSIVGVLRSDDMLEIMSKTASENILNVGGVSVEGGEGAFWGNLKGRLPWLVMSLIYSSFSSLVIRFFRDITEQVHNLTVLMPLVASIGGILGIQSVSIVIKAFAEGTLRQTAFTRIIFKESLLGLCEGIVIGFLVGFIVFWVFSDWKLGCVVSSAMLFNMTWAAFAGASLPIICAKLGFDSAICSGPIITTITDVAGYVIFLSLAQWIFG